MIHFYVKNKLDPYSLHILSEVTKKYGVNYTVHEQFRFPEGYDFEEQSTHVFCGSAYFTQLRETIGAEERSLKQIQGFIYPFENDTRFVFFYALPYLFIDPTVLIDLEQIIRISSLDIDPDLDNCTNVVCQSEQDLQSLYNKISSIDYPIALDLETSGLSAYEDEILCIAIGLTENLSYIIPKELLNYHKTIDILELEHVQWVGHNAKFDAGFIYQHYGIHIAFKHDTMLLHYVLDERQGTHGLKPLSCRLLGLPDYEEGIRKYLPRKDSSYALIPPDALYKYAGYDVCFTVRLLDRLKYFVSSSDNREGYIQVYEFLMEASDMFIDIETTGMYFDLVTAQELEKNYFEKEEDIKSQITEITHEGFNPGSPKQVGEFLYTKLGLEDPYVILEKKPLCTDKETLAYLQKVYPDIKVLPLLLELRKLSKIRATYITALIKRTESDNRLRTQMKLHGTVTGRLSSSQPNFQNFPRVSRNEYARPIRNLITATDKDTILLGADYSQAEIRVAAILSQESFYQQVYSQGLDVHTETAKKLFDLEIIPCEGMEGYSRFIEQRSLAKNLNFGLIYGQGAAAIARLYNMDMNEAQSLYDQFYMTIPNLAKWLQDTRNFAYENGYCTTPFGRQRRFGFCISPELQNEIGFGESNQWRIKTMSGNFAIQSLASDITLRAAIDLHNDLKSSEFIHGKILALVHDAIYLEVPKRSLNITTMKLEEYMLEAPKKILGKNSQGELFVPFSVDIHSNKKWGEL